MPSTAEKMLALLSDFELALQTLAKEDSANPLALLSAFAVPMARRALEDQAERNAETWDRFADTMAALWASFRGDSSGGFVYLPGAFSPLGEAAAFAVSAVAVGSDATHLVVELGEPVEVLEPTLERVMDAVQGLSQLGASVPGQGLGDWLGQLGQVDVRPVAPPALPGPQSGGGPGQ